MRLDTQGEPAFIAPMRRLTAIEHARTKGRIITMSMPDRGPDARARIVAWLEARTGSGWFYARGDNYYFETQTDASAFKQWMMSEMVG